MLGFIRKKISRSNFFSIPDSTPYKLIFPFNIQEGFYGMKNYNNLIVENRISREELQSLFSEIKNKCGEFKYFTEILRIVDYTNKFLTTSLLTTFIMILLGMIIQFLNNLKGLHIISIIGVAMGGAALIASLIFILYFNCTFDENVIKSSLIVKNVLNEKNIIYLPRGLQFMQPTSNGGNTMAWIELHLEFKFLQTNPLNANNINQIVNESQPLQNNLCQNNGQTQIEFQNFNHVIVGQPIYHIQMNQGIFQSPQQSFEYGDNHPVLQKEDED